MMKKDIISELPLELAQRIFVHLEPEDVGRCLCVSKSWRRSANTDYIWRNFSNKYLDIHKSIERNSGGGDGELCKWASIFMSSYSKMRINWQKNRYKTVVQERKGEFICSLRVGRKLMVVGYTSGIVEVLSFPNLKTLQILELGIPGIEMLSIQIADDLFTLTKSNITLIYRKFPGKTDFILVEAVAINKIVTSIRDASLLNAWLPSVIKKGILWESRLLVSGCIWLRRRGSGAVVVWDTVPSTGNNQSHKASFRRMGKQASTTPPLAALASYSNSVFASASSSFSIIRFNPRGTPLQLIETGIEVESLLPGPSWVLGGVGKGQWGIWKWGFHDLYTFGSDGQPLPLPTSCLDNVPITLLFGGRMAWGPRGILIHASPLQGSLIITAWIISQEGKRMISSLVGVSPIWSASHRLAHVSQKPSVTTLVVVLQRFVFCHYVIKGSSEYILLDASNGTLLYNNPLRCGFVDHIDERGIVSIKVKMESSLINLRRFDGLPHNTPFQHQSGREPTRDEGRREESHLPES